MRVASIRKMDITNGPGIRVSIFTQGCRLHCVGCFNSSTWDFTGGERWGPEKETLVLDLCDRPHIAGLSILGGEPLSPENYDDLLSFLIRFRERFPEKTVWMWTGKVFESLNDMDRQILEQVDVLIDGPFDITLHGFNLPYRGSKNQRILDVPASLRSDYAINYTM